MYYDSNETPSCPAVRIRITDNFQGSTFAPFPALIDTGADVTCVPEAITAGVTDLIYERVQVDFADGPARMGKCLYLAEATIEFLDDLGQVLLAQSYRDLYLLVLPDGLLGRDVLKYHICQLDGPSQRCRIT
jgi:hypothetical protein